METPVITKTVFSPGSARCVWCTVYHEVGWCELTGTHEQPSLGSPASVSQGIATPGHCIGGSYFPC